MAILDQWFGGMTPFGATGSPEAMESDKEVSDLLQRLTMAQDTTGESASLPFAGMMMVDTPKAAQRPQTMAQSVEPRTLESGTPPGPIVEQAAKRTDRLEDNMPIRGGGVTNIARTPGVLKGNPTAPAPDFSPSLGERISNFGNALTGRDYVSFDEQGRTRSSTYNALIEMGLNPKMAEAAARQPELLKALLASKLGGKGRTNYGLAPQWGIRKDAEGNPVLGPDGQPQWVMLQAGDDATVAESRLPPGVAPVPPGDIAGAKKYSTEIGKTAAEAEAMIGSVGNQVKKAFKDINRLRSHPGLDAATGLSSRLDPRNYIPGSDAWNFSALNKTAKAESFMAAREGLKGAGQVTDFEGEKGEQAIANLENAQSREQYLEALDTLEEMLRASYEDLRRKSELGGFKGGGSGQPPAARGGMTPGRGGIPADARVGKDGRLYSPDPDRPGKYLQW